MSHAEARIGAGTPNPRVGDPGRPEYRELPAGVRAIVGKDSPNDQGEPRYRVYLGIPHRFPVNGVFRRGGWGASGWNRDMPSEEYQAANAERDNFRLDYPTDGKQPISYVMFEIDRGSTGELVAMDVTSAGLPQDHRIELQVNHRGPSPTTVLTYEGRELDGTRVERTSDNVGDAWIVRDINDRIITNRASMQPGTELSLEATQRIFDFVHGQGEFADSSR